MRRIKSLLYIGCGSLIVGMGMIVIAGLSEKITDADLIIVPGNTIAPDGTPSPRLQARLDAALHLYQTGKARLIFVSGGIGKEGFDESLSMSNYLKGHGVSAEAIVLDSKGIDTAATAKNAAVFMRAKQLKSALIASQYFHIPRTQLALERNGIIVAGSAYARYFEMRDIYSTLRETVAYAAYFAKT